jgi:hypothetical protein
MVPLAAAPPAVIHPFLDNGISNPPFFTFRGGLSREGDGPRATATLALASRLHSKGGKFLVYATKTIVLPEYVTTRAGTIIRACTPTKVAYDVTAFLFVGPATNANHNYIYATPRTVFCRFGR